MSLPPGVLPFEEPPNALPPGVLPFASAAYDGPPTLLPEARGAAVDGMVQGTVAPEDLYANTIKALRQKYGPDNVMETFDESSGTPQPDGIIVTDTSTGQQQAYSVGRELGQIHHEAFTRLKGEAQKQPEAGGWERAKKGMKATEAGEIDYLRHQHPDARVIPDADESGNYTGNAIIAEPGKPPRQIDDQGTFNLRDVADVSGDLLEGVLGGVGAVAGAATGVPGAAIGGAGVGSAAGSTVRQAISAQLPGDDELGPGMSPERLKRVGISAAVGMTGEAIPVAGKAIWGAPGKLVRSAFVGGADDAIKQGLALEARTGVNLSADALVNSPESKTFGAMLAQRPGSSNTMVGANQRTSKQAGDFLDKVFEANLGGHMSAEEAGKRTGAAYRGVVDRLAGDRAKTAEQLFGEVDRLAGGERVVPIPSFTATLDKLIEQAAPAVRTTAMDAEAGELRYLRKLIPADGKVTAQNFNRLLSKIGNGSRGSGKVFQELETADDRRFARELFGSLKADLDAAANTGGAAGAANVDGSVAPVARALKKARDTYAAMSKQIEDVDHLMVQKAFALDDAGKAEFLPRDVMRKGAMSSENVRRGMALLDKADPAAASGLRRSALETSLAELAPKSGHGAAAEVPIDLQRFTRWHAENKPRLEVLLGGDKGTLSALDDLAEIGRRIGPITSDVNSQTARMLWWKRLFDSVKGGEAGIVNALKTASGLTTAKGLAEKLTDPVKRDLFLGLVKPRPGAAGITVHQLTRTLTQLGALDATGHSGPRVSTKRQAPNTIARGYQ